MDEMGINSDNGSETSAGLTVLVVEPEPLLRQREVETLENLGYEDIVQTSNTTHAIRTLKRGGIDMVFSGWIVPPTGGIDLLRKVRSNPNLFTTPFILVADTLTQRQVLQAGQSGVSDIIILPLSSPTFGRKMSKLLQPPKDDTRNEAESRISHGKDLMEQGKWEEALDSFQHVLEVYENAEIYYNLGFIRTSQEKYDEALDYFRKATEINNAFARAYQQMALCYQKTGQDDLAEKAFQKAADIFMEKGMDESAEEMLNEVLKINPDTVNVYNSLGIVYRKKGDFDRALEQYKKALKVDSKDENILYNLARAYYDVGDMSAAADTLGTALSYRPNFKEALVLLKAIERAVTNQSKK